jgi:hypothetical protein
MAREQYRSRRERMYDEATMATPIPRHMFKELVRRDEAGDEMGLTHHISRMWVGRRLQLSARALMDTRMLAYIEPEQMQDHWQNWLTGSPLAKLRRSGLNLEVYQWPAAMLEALVGLLAGYKPMAYQLAVLSDDELSQAQLMRAAITEKWLYREMDAQDYPVLYQDSIAYIQGIGRAGKLITVHPKTKRIRTLPVWPGHIAAFWQEDQRTIEQVIVARNMSVGEAVSMWPDRAADIEAAVYKGATRGSRIGHNFDSRSEVDLLLAQDAITVLSCWYRLGDYGDEQIGEANILIGASQDKRPGGRVLLDYDDDTKYPDIPARITPRFKSINRPPDEARGAMDLIAGVVTEYDETLSAFKDMVWAGVYPRFVGLGFTTKSAPRIDRTIGGVIPLPRTDQRLQRLEETINTVPPEQLLARQTELIITFAGLSRHFISPPPSETSGEAIGASIHASIMRLEPQRTNIQRDEIWTFRMWSALGSRFGSTDEKYVLNPWPTIDLTWRDIRPREEIRAKQMALAAVQQAIISKDTARDEWSIINKEDEVRKIMRERTNPYTNPEHVSQTASALIQLARARQMMQPQPGAPNPQDNNSNAAAQESLATANAQGAPPSGVSDNEPGGILPATSQSSPSAPPPAQGGGY